MTVDFVRTAEDFVYFHQHLRAVRRAMRRFWREMPPNGVRSAPTSATWMVVVLVFGGTVLSFASAAYLAKISSSAWLVGVVAMGTFLALLLRFTLFPRSAKSIRVEYEKDPTNRLATTAIADDAGFHFVATTWRYDVEWSGILGVLLLGEGVVIVDIEERAHFIPRCAFAEDDQAKAFVAEIEAHLRREREN